MIKKILAYPLLFSIAITLISCGKDHHYELRSDDPQDKTVNVSADSTQTNDVVSDAPYMHDYDVLWDALRNSYPYYEYLNETRDMEELYKSYAAEVITIESESKFASLIQRLTRELGGFAHLELLSNASYQSYYYLYVLNNDLASDEWVPPFASILQDPRLSDIYVPPVSSETYEGSVSDSYHVPSVKYYDDCNALYIKISSFNHALIDRDRNLVYDSLTKYPDTENVIFDIIGNTGGSTFYWEDVLVEPFGGSNEYSCRQYFKSSELIDQFMPAGSSYPVDGLDNVPKWVKDYGLDRYYEFSTVTPQNGTDTTYNDIKRWVLVDGRVFSAAEWFVYFCKKTGWATVVGYKTLGDGMGATPLLLLLPDSGLLVRFSYVAAENDRGECDAVKGTVPDLICVKNDTPINKCLEAIRAGDN